MVLIMEAVNTSETSVNLYEISWRNIPENKSSSKGNIFLNLE
jgi:hypothetical protein